MAQGYISKSPVQVSHSNYFHAKDPISALTHFIGFILSVVFTPILLCRVGQNTESLVKLIGYSIFCISMTVLYGASTSYHTFILPKKQELILKKIDHISIFFLIAGTYTPLCLSVLDPVNGKQLLVAIWSVAIIGSIMKAFWVTCPKIVSSFIYILMGWIALIKLGAVYASMTKLQFIILLIGGLIYTAGGIIYAMKFSINEYWGEHELFHLFILGGSLFHYILLYTCA